jgi:DNA polymerase III delta subunit
LPDDILEWLERPGLPNAQCYWLTGGEELLRERALLRLRQAFLEPGFADFNHSQVKVATNSKMSSLLGALSELPMLCDRRLLEIHQIHELPAKVADEFALYLRKEGMHQSLILVLVGDTPKSKSSLWEWCKGHAQELVCELDVKQRGRFIDFCLAQGSLKLSSAQRQQVLDRCGSSLRQIQTSLSQLALFAGQRTSISDADLDLLVHDSSEVQSWKLTEAIGRRDQPKAYAILHRLLHKKEEAAGLLSYINSYLLGLVQVLELRPRLKTAAAIAKELPRRSEFQVRKSLEELSTWSERELELAFERLARADHRIKSGTDPVLMLQLLLLQLTTRKGTARG